MTEPPWAPQQWSQPYPGIPPLSPGRRNGLGITALVSGIVSLVLCWFPFVGLGLGICAVVAGAVGRRRIKRGEADNNGPTVTGIVLGIITVVIGSAILLLIFFVIVDHEGCIENAKNRYEYSQCH